MKRRTFIKRSSAVGVPLMVGGINVSALNSPFFNVLNTGDEKVLVLINLSGGNDGLNTVIPKDQYANLSQARSNVLIPENQILDLTDTVGLHPAMDDIKNMYDDGKINIIQSVGYPDQNRSHFRSSDIWHSGSPSNEVWNTGWLGRYFDTIAPGYPTDYPNDSFPDPLAVTIGTTTSQTCEGVGGNFSLALVDPDNLTALSTPVNSDLPDSCYGDKMDFMITSIIQTNAYNEVVETANSNGNNLSTKYAEDNQLANALKLVARLISGGMQTKVYVVQLGGFDTHGDQVVGGDTTTGEHAQLLNTLSDAICAFQDDLELLGLNERVVGMTYSEFGRRIRSNASLGTDHGTAAPLMLFGSCINPGIMGENPEVSADVDVQEGVPMQFDFRSIYGSLLMDWFQLDEALVQDLLYQDFQYIPVLQACDTPTNTDEISSSEVIDLDVFPNPFNQNTTVQFTIPAGFAKISLFDVIGNELRVISSGLFNAGTHTIQMEANGLAPGTYYYRIQTKHGRKVKRVVRMR